MLNIASGGNCVLKVGPISAQEFSLVAAKVTLQWIRAT